MSTELQLTAAGTKAVLFELDRFEPTEDGRLEVRGRWSGVRGRRFVRPTLTTAGEHSKQRLLADLEHKPWLAEEGEEWVAAFPWDGGNGELAAASLAVAPDIEVELPAPGAGGGKHGPSASDPHRALRERELELVRLRRALERSEAALQAADSEHNETVAAAARERQAWEAEWAARRDSLAKQ